MRKLAALALVLVPACTASGRLAGVGVSTGRFETELIAEVFNRIDPPDPQPSKGPLCDPAFTTCPRLEPQVRSDCDPSKTPSCPDMDPPR